MIARMLVLLLGGLLVLAGSAEAVRPATGLTTAEQTDLRALLTAYTTNIVAAYSCIADTFDYDDTDTVVYNKYLWGKLNVGWLSHANFTFYMLGVNPFNDAGAGVGGSDYDNYEVASATPAGRASTVTFGMGYLSNTKTYMQQVSDGVDDATVQAWYAGKNAAWKTALACVKTQVLAALTVLNTIDTGRTYLNARNLLYWPRGFGPHGSWVEGTNTLAFGIIILNTSLESVAGGLLAAYDVRAQSEAAWSAGSLAQFKAALKLITGDIAPRWYRTLYNWSMIATTATECTFSPLMLVARSMEQALLNCNDCSTTSAGHGGPITGTPYFFTSQYATWYAAWILDLAARPLTWAKLDRWEFDFTTAWRWADGGNGAIGLLPSHTTLDALRAQPNIPRNDPQWTGALTCP